jgi:hypothetical protein
MQVSLSLTSAPLLVYRPSQHEREPKEEMTITERIGQDVQERNSHGHGIDHEKSDSNPKRKVLERRRSDGSLLVLSHDHGTVETSLRYQGSETDVDHRHTTNRTFLTPSKSLERARSDSDGAKEAIVPNQGNPSGKRWSLLRKVKKFLHPRMKRRASLDEVFSGSRMTMCEAGGTIDMY